MVCTRVTGCNSQPANSFGLKISLYFCPVWQPDYLSTIRVITKKPEKLKAKVGQVIELEATPEWASSRYHRTPVVFLPSPVK